MKETQIMRKIRIAAVFLGCLWSIAWAKDKAYLIPKEEFTAKVKQLSVLTICDSTSEDISDLQKKTEKINRMFDSILDGAKGWEKKSEHERQLDEARYYLLRKCMIPENKAFKDSVYTITYQKVITWLQNKNIFELRLPEKSDSVESEYFLKTWLGASNEDANSDNDFNSTINAIIYDRSGNVLWKNHAIIRHFDIRYAKPKEIYSEDRIDEAVNDLFKKLK